MGRPAKTDSRSSLAGGETSEPIAAPQDWPKNRILRAIPNTEYQLISGSLEPWHFHQHDTLHEPWRKLEYCYFPNRGLISLLVLTEDGRTVEAGMVGNEGVAGVAAAVGMTISTLRFLVQMPCDVFRVSVAALRDRLKLAPQFRLALCRYAMIQAMQMAQTAACNRFHDAGQRLARWLLMAADRVHLNPLPITHDFLATTLGTDRPSVSLAAKTLQKRRIIQYRRGSVEILNRRRLEASACECYRINKQLLGLGLPTASPRRTPHRSESTSAEREVF
jgi:CRP-like cAMP-binding protein